MASNWHRYYGWELTKTPIPPKTRFGLLFTSVSFFFFEIIACLQEISIFFLRFGFRVFWLQISKQSWEAQLWSLNKKDCLSWHAEVNCLLFDSPVFFFFSRMSLNESRNNTSLKSFSLSKEKYNLWAYEEGFSTSSQKYNSYVNIPQSNFGF